MTESMVGMRAEFERSLDHADEEFVEAALIVAESMPRLTRAFLAGDVSSIPDARTMAREVLDKVRDVEDRAFVIIAREAPVGHDLRRVVALLRLAMDVDRSASLLRHVSETLRRFDPRTLPATNRQQLQELADRSTEVFRAGVDAWRSRDAEAIHAVEELDDRVDKLQEQLVHAATDDERLADAALALGLIARYFERIADHGVAMARDITFVVTGERIGLEKP